MSKKELPAAGTGKSAPEKPTSSHQPSTSEPKSEKKKVSMELTCREKKSTAGSSGNNSGTMTKNFNKKSKVKPTSSHEPFTSEPKPASSIVPLTTSSNPTASGELSSTEADPSTLGVPPISRPVFPFYLYLEPTVHLEPDTVSSRLEVRQSLKANLSTRGVSTAPKTKPSTLEVPSFSEPNFGTRGVSPTSKPSASSKSSKSKPKPCTSVSPHLSQRTSTSVSPSFSLHRSTPDVTFQPRPGTSGESRPSDLAVPSTSKARCCIPNDPSISIHLSSWTSRSYVNKEVEKSPPKKRNSERSRRKEKVSELLAVSDSSDTSESDRGCCVLVKKFFDNADLGDIDDIRNKGVKKNKQGVKNTSFIGYLEKRSFLKKHVLKIPSYQKLYQRELDERNGIVRLKLPKNPYRLAIVTRTRRRKTEVPPIIFPIVVIKESAENPKLRKRLLNELKDARSPIHRRLQPVPAPRQTMPAPRRTMPAPRRTMPPLRRPIPVPRRTMPVLRRAMPAFRRTVPAPRLTMPAPRRTMPAPRRTQQAFRRTQQAPHQTLHLTRQPTSQPSTSGQRSEKKYLTAAQQQAAFRRIQGRAVQAYFAKVYAENLRLIEIENEEKKKKKKKKRLMAKLLNIIRQSSSRVTCCRRARSVSPPYTRNAFAEVENQYEETSFFFEDGGTKLEGDEPEPKNSYQYDFYELCGTAEEPAEESGTHYTAVQVHATAEESADESETHYTVAQVHATAEESADESETQYESDEVDETVERPAKDSETQYKGDEVDKTAEGPAQETTELPTEETAELPVEETSQSEFLSFFSRMKI